MKRCSQYSRELGGEYLKLDAEIWFKTELGGGQIWSSALGRSWVVTSSKRLRVHWGLPRAIIKRHSQMLLSI